MEFEIVKNKMLEYGIVTPREMEIAIFLCGETDETLASLLQFNTGFATTDAFMAKAKQWDEEDTLKEEIE